MIIKKGFTLVELLVVIAILSILSTLGITNFQSTRAKARDLSRKSDLQTIAKSLEAYVNDHRSYPTSSADGKIVCQPSTSTVCEWDAPFTDGTSIYAATLPIDSSSAHYYRYSSDGTSYTIYARLENPNDPDIITLTDIFCGAASDLCNYKINSSNIQ